jgi:hypothetical protein
MILDENPFRRVGLTSLIILDYKENVFLLGIQNKLLKGLIHA